ncbi:MAG: AarF/UbiB family protein [Ornithinimicrobium sp.]
MDWLINVLLVIGLALVVRSLLGTRYVTWLRLVVAGVGGLVLGAVAAVFVVDRSGGIVDAGGNIQAEANVVALPLQIIVTMGLVTMFELALAKPADRRGMLRNNPISTARRRSALAARGAKVSAIAARHGFAARTHLGEAKTPRQWGRELRLTLEELGGVYVKLGQILAARPDLLGPEVSQELHDLQSGADPLPFADIVEVLTSELGAPDAHFASIEEDPLGSASIAQAHAARLLDGTPVVIKVQRPGLTERISHDLAILDWLAVQLEQRSAAARAYGARRLASEFSATLRDELDFTVEAGHMDAARTALDSDPLLSVPAPYMSLTTSRVLVMERFDGRPLADAISGKQTAEPDGARLAEALCHSQVSAIMAGEMFHADPHLGNVLLLANGNLGLIDFGMTGQLDSFGRAFVVELMGAVQLGDPAMMYEALITGGSVDPGVDRLVIERALAGYLATYQGGEVLSGDGLAAMFRLAAEQGIALPSQASTMLRTVATLSGTLEALDPDFPFVERVSNIAGLEVLSRFKPENARKTLQREMAVLLPFAKRLPAHVERIATQVERGELSARVSVLQHPGDVAVLDRLLSRILLVISALGVLLVSVILLSFGGGTALGGTELRLADLLGWVGLFSGTVLLLRSLLESSRLAP